MISQVYTHTNTIVVADTDAEPSGSQRHENNHRHRHGNRIRHEHRHNTQPPKRRGDAPHIILAFPVSLARILLLLISQSPTFFFLLHTCVNANPTRTKIVTHQPESFDSFRKKCRRQEAYGSKLPCTGALRHRSRNLTGTIRKSGTGILSCHNCIYIHTHLHINIHIHIHTYIHIYIHKHTYTHIHTYMSFITC